MGQGLAIKDFKEGKPKLIAFSEEVRSQSPQRPKAMNHKDAKNQNNATSAPGMFGSTPNLALKTRPTKKRK